MKRKLVKQGFSTMMVSLPSKWIKANKLDKGDEIDMEESGNRLIIGTSTKGKKEVIIELNEENRKDINNILTHVYRSGFDKITIKKASNNIKEIRKFVEEPLLGFEVTESSKGEIVIENISEPAGKKYDLMLKKTFQIIHETQDIIINDFEENKFSNLTEINDLKKQQDRFLLFCRRLLVKENVEKTIISNWEVLNFLMHIEHRYSYLYKYASENKLTKNKDILELLKAAKDYFKLYEDAYYNKNIASIHRINNLREIYYLGKCIKYLEKSRGKDSVILSYIRETFRIIQLGTSPILNELLEN